MLILSLKKTLIDKHEKCSWDMFNVVYMKKSCFYLMLTDGESIYKRTYAI